MPRYIIECDVEGAQDLTEDELIKLARTSSAAVESLGVPYTWVTSYATADKLYCVHEAEDADADIDEPLRRLHVLIALAEAMWLTGVPDERVKVDAVSEVVHLDQLPGTEWSVGELAVWLDRLGQLSERPVAVAEPFQLSLDGRHADAAAWWHRPAIRSPRRWPGATPTTPITGPAAYNCWTTSAPSARPIAAGSSSGATASPRCRSDPGPAPGPIRPG